MAAYIRSERSGDRPPGATSNQGVSSSRKRPRPVGETGTFLEDRNAQESSPMQSLMASFGGPSIFRETFAVAIGSGETAVFVVIDHRMVTLETVVHRRDGPPQP